MKYYAFLFLLLITHTSYCQTADSNTKVPPLPLTGNRVIYTAHISTDTSLSKAQLVHNAEEWYQHNFETADNTLTIDNVSDGEVSGTGMIRVKDKERAVDPADIFFTIDIMAGKGTYEYKIHGIYGMDKTGKFYYSDMYNEELYPLQKPKWPENSRRAMLNSMNTRINTMIARMRESMEKK